MKLKKHHLSDFHFKTEIISSSTALLGSRAWRKGDQQNTDTKQTI